MKHKKAGRILWTAVILVAVLTCMFLIHRHLSPKVQPGNKHIAISIVFEDGTKKDYALDTSAEYLKEALESVATIDGEESAEYGYTLYTVDGVTADFQKGSCFWAIYVNGEYGTYGLAKQPVIDGDAYTIAYEQY